MKLSSPIFWRQAHDLECISRRRSLAISIEPQETHTLTDSEMMGQRVLLLAGFSGLSDPSCDMLPFRPTVVGKRLSRVERSSMEIDAHCPAFWMLLDSHRPECSCRSTCTKQLYDEAEAGSEARKGPSGAVAVARPAVMLETLALLVQ